MHIDELAREAAAGADAAGGKSVVFNTITVSDGISMGTPGMRYSLVSREVIADSIETVVGRRGLRRPRRDRRLRQEHAGLRDGDGAARTARRCSSTAARSARASKQARHRLGLRGGRQPRRRQDQRRGAQGSRVAPRFPGPGRCGGMYTANTMASAIEALGHELPNSSAQEAVSSAKSDDCRRAGAAVVAAARSAASSRATS